ncbi:MAG: DUF2784 domain-containing protein [Candidatus Sumerlaeota bacterium]|nr:DUF2784 domain-containing protein [Candidatus Sumerlaeota bacterium]
MNGHIQYQILADAILIVHTAFIAFVVFGFGLILAGAWRRWAWTRNLWFRLAHLLAIAGVAAQSIAGQICPLTIWENQLREAAGDAPYSGAFIQHWLQKLIFYEAPDWVFAVAYAAFALMVLATLIFIPPIRRKAK